MATPQPVEQTRDERPAHSKDAAGHEPVSNGIEAEPREIEPDRGNPLRDRIEGEAREIERDCRIAVRCHREAAAGWTLRYYLFGLPTAAFAALAGASAFSHEPVVTASFAVAATISAAINTFLNAGQTATAHAKKRSEYEQLKNEIRIFRNITMEMDRPERELIRELIRHSNARDVLNLESPQLSGKKYRRVKSEIKKAEQEREREEKDGARLVSAATPS